MTDRDVIDFDAAFAEARQGGTPLRVRLGGTVFDLPPALPARALLVSARARGASRDLNLHEVALVVGDLFGDRADEAFGFIKSATEMETIIIAFIRVSF